MTEELKLVVINVVCNNNLNNLHNFIYHCQNTNIDKLNLLPINLHKLLQSCIKVKHSAIVLKGDPGKSKFWLENEFIMFMKNQKKRLAIIEEANTKVKNVNKQGNEIIYSFLDIEDKYGKFNDNYIAVKKGSKRDLQGILDV